MDKIAFKDISTQKAQRGFWEHFKVPDPLVKQADLGAVAANGKFLKLDYLKRHFLRSLSKGRFNSIFDKQIQSHPIYLPLRK